MQSLKPLWMLFLTMICWLGVMRGQRPGIDEPLRAGPDDPLYTTLAADLTRSEYLVDEGYQVDYFTRTEPLRFITDTAGVWSLVWKLGPQVVRNLGDYAAPPVVDYIFPDLVVLRLRPYRFLEVRAVFFVYSSRVALLDLEIVNRDARSWPLVVYTEFQASAGRFRAARVNDARDGVFFDHYEPPNRWSETPPKAFEPEFRDLVRFSRPMYSWSGYWRDLTEYLSDYGWDFLPGGLRGSVRAWRAMTRLELKPGEREHLRVVRAVQPRSQPETDLVATAQAGLDVDWRPYLEAQKRRFRRIPHLRGVDRRDWMVYLSAFNLMRQMFLPPEGATSFNYYVFSREPTWSWGHDGQVFHESISMMAYAYLDPQSAMDAQRVFMERQSEDGYMYYRIGPYAARTFPVKGERTSSAPFFSWENWTLYRIHPDRAFLEEAYRAGTRFMDFWFQHRDKDGDGLLEWGGHAVLESVRDAFVAIWDLLGGGPEAPARVDALDLNCMAVKEMKALAAMARELGRPDEARQWQQRADGLARRINETMWDPETRFYYHIHRDTHRFTTPDDRDLRRMEIIGFLPLWARIVPESRLPDVLRHLTDPNKFWRPFGVPTVAADDPSYNPFITRCCQWNGAIWLPWQYMVFEGLLQYGRRDLAEELLRRNLAAVRLQLSRNHRFWETFSPDLTRLEGIYNYIWDGILARMLVLLYGPRK